MGRNYPLRVAIEKQLKDRITTMNDKELSGIYSYLISCGNCNLSHECSILKRLECAETIERLLKGELENGTD